MIGDAVQGSLFGGGLFDEPAEGLLVERDDGSVGSLPPSHPNRKVGRVLAHLTQSKSLYYNAKSGLHKEVRRGCFPLAWAYARQLESCRKGEAKRYLRSIWAEESRNLRLFSGFYDGTDLRDLVRMFCRAAKDWEVPGDPGICMSRWYSVMAQRGWSGASEDVNVYPWTSDPVGIVREMIERDRMPELLEACIHMTGGSDDGYDALARCRGIIVDEAVKRHPGIPIVKKMAAKYHPEEILFLYTLISGERDAHAQDYFHEASDDYKVDVPYYRNYVYDIHTRVGKTRWAKSGHLVKWGRPTVTGIDIRWSGCNAGTLWRQVAFIKHGRCDVDWDKASPDGAVLADWLICEGDAIR